MSPCPGSAGISDNLLTFDFLYLMGSFRGGGRAKGSINCDSDHSVRRMATVDEKVVRVQVDIRTDISVPDSFNHLSCT